MTFTDLFGNLTDVETNVIFTGAAYSSSGTITLARTSLGVSTATTSVVWQAGDYALSLAGALTTMGNNRFTVAAGALARATVEGLPETLTAGEYLPALTLRFWDAFGNPTEYGGATRFEITRQDGTLAAPALETARQSAGFLTASAWQLTTAGTYRLRLELDAAVVAEGNLALVVNPAPAAQAEFAGVPDSLTAGQALPAFTVTFRDPFGNLTDYEANLSFVGATGSSAGTISLRRTSVGVSTATQTALWAAGEYALPLAGGVQTAGNNRFVVAPAALARATVEGLPETLGAGEYLPALTLRFWDAFGNPTEAQAFADSISFDLATNATTATQNLKIQTMSANFGTLAATPRQLATAATYTLRVAGLGGLGGLGQAALEGSTVLVVAPGQAARVRFVGVTTAALRTLVLAPFHLVLTDAFDNPVSFGQPPEPPMLEIANAELTSSATLQLFDAGIPGMCSAVGLAFFQPGNYTLRVAGQPALAVEGNNAVAVFNPPPFAFALFPARSTAASLESWTLTLYGWGFVADTRVLLDGEPLETEAVRLEGLTELRLRLPVSITSVIGEHNVALQTPEPGGGATSATLLVSAPAPAIETLQPNRFVVADSARTLDVWGRNFTPNSQVIVSNGVLTTTFLDSAHIAVTLPPSLMRRVGTNWVKVTNPTLEGGLSEPSLFTVSAGAARYAEFAGVAAQRLTGGAQGDVQIVFRDEFDNPTNFDGVLTYANAEQTVSGAIPLRKTYADGVSTATVTAFPTPGRYQLSIIDKRTGATLPTKGRTLFEVIAPADSAAARYYDFTAIYKNVRPQDTVVMMAPAGYEATTNVVRAQFTEYEIPIRTDSASGALNNEMIVYIRKIRADIASSPPALKAPRGSEEGGGGLRSAPSAITLSVAPTPFDQEASIEYVLPEGGWVHCEVYRFVRRFALLANARQEAGAHRLVWKPGANVPSGVYLVRLTFTNDRGEIQQQIEKLEYVK